MKRNLLVLVLSLVAVVASANAVPDSTWSYVPEFHGVTRIFYRLATSDGGGSRFEVANARLSAGGRVFPWLSYFIQPDFCANGKIKIMDAYAKVTPVDGLSVIMGQCRVPFSVDASRQVWDYYFVDIATPAALSSLRSTGIKAGYKVPGTRLYVEGGVFNATDMTDHTRWNSSMTYAVKANISFAGLRPEVCFMSRGPSDNTFVRYNQFDASLSYTLGGFFAETEYLYRHYCGVDFPDTHAWSVFADYGVPLKARMADRLSFQIRYDGANKVSAGSRAADSDLPLNVSVERFNRITAGVTASRHIGKCMAAFRINYEQYFYSKEVPHQTPNQLIAGLIFHF